MRAASLAVLALLAACAGPKPCTRTLCVARLDGTLRVEGWERAVVASAASPQPPLVNNARAAVEGGPAAFVTGRTLVRAQAGSAFVFTVSTAAIPSIAVESGLVTVSPFHGAEVPVAPGATYALPKP